MGRSSMVFYNGLKRKVEALFKMKVLNKKIWKLMKTNIILHWYYVEYFTQCSINFASPPSQGNSSTGTAVVSTWRSLANKLIDSDSVTHQIYLPIQTYIPFPRRQNTHDNKDQKVT